MLNVLVLLQAKLLLDLDCAQSNKDSFSYIFKVIYSGTSSSQCSTLQLIKEPPFGFLQCMNLAEANKVYGVIGLLEN